MTDSRTLILHHACELYLKEGLKGFSMRKLARLVGVTAPAIYRHFANREAVLVAVVGEAYKLLGQYLYRSLSGQTPWERLALAGHQYMAFALENPRQYEMIYVSPGALGVDDLPGEVETLACSTGQFWHDRVRELVDVGLFRAGDPEQISGTLWAHAHGLLVLYHRGMLDVSEEEFRMLFMESSRRIMLGLGTDRLENELESLAHA